MSTYLSVADLNKLVMAFQPLRCWRFGKYLGSMLTLDFGDQIDVTTHDSTTVQEGALKIGIRNVFWAATDRERAIADAKNIDDKTFSAQVSQRPIGAALSGISSADNGRWITFGFDNGFALNVDTTNTWKTQSDIFEIMFPDGRIVVLDKDGAFEALDEIEPTRAERWRARLI